MKTHNILFFLAFLCFAGMIISICDSWQVILTEWIGGIGIILIIIAWKFQEDDRFKK